VQKQKWWKLLQDIASIECKRQTTMQEFLLCFVPREKRLFATFVSLQTPVLNKLGQRLSDDTKENSIQKALQETVMTVGPTQGITMADREHSDSTPASILVPESSMRLVERKIGSSNWEQTLVVTTTDSIMHLLHIPSNSLSSGKMATTPEVIDLLVGPMSSEGYQFQTRTQNLTPFESYHLPTCTTYQDGRVLKIDNENSFMRRTVYLRTSCAQDTQQLMHFLKGP